MPFRVRGMLGWGLAALLVLAACGAGEQPNGGPGSPQTGPRLGSFDRPIVIAFVPSQETSKILKSGDAIASALSSATGLKFKAQVPISYAATIEGMCSAKVDVAFLTPLSYVLANDKGCADFLTASVRNGLPTYRGQIRVRADSGITDICELKGKKFAFTDAVSTSGTLYPTLLFKTKCGANSATEFFGASNVVFAGGHDRSMIALYGGQVDGAASFIDAATDVAPAAVKLISDIVTKTKRIAETEDIPGDPQTVRKGIPAELKEKIRQALLDYAKTDAGKKAIFDLYSIEGFAVIPDASYDKVRDAAKLAGINLETEVQKTARPPATPAPSPTKSP